MPGDPAQRDGRPDVVAIIPTTGRATLTAAVHSALQQTWPIARVIVAVDGPTDLVHGLPDDPRVEVISASAYGSGGNAARAAGLDRVAGGLVALLDDDDVWDLRKTEVQVNRYLELRRTTQQAIVLACRAREVGPDGELRDIMPKQVLAPGQKVADYLFERTSIVRPGGKINSSMLLFDAELARQVPFDTSLLRHQDWDWLLRVDAESAAWFEMVPDVLLDYLVAPDGQSTSSSKGWQNSQQWVARHAHLLTPRQQAELLLSVTLPIALKHGKWGAAAKILLSTARLRPSPHSLAFGLAHVPLLAQRRVRSLLSRPATAQQAPPPTPVVAAPAAGDLSEPAPPRTPHASVEHDRPRTPARPAATPPGHGPR